MSNFVPPTTPIGGPAGEQFPPQQPFPPPPPQKKSNVMVWVLAGCGTFIVIGVIAVFLGGYFVWNKAKEAGLDPELMQKRPALAVAKMMVAANPDVELVSVDDEKGLITIKDKKTGKIVTVNLDEAKSGKITFKGDGKDEEVTLEAKGEGDTGSLEVKTKDGSAKFGTGSAAKLPAWLSAYPGATIQGTFSAEGKDGEGGSFNFSTTDSIENVVKFYEDNLKQAGLKVTTNTVQQNGVVSMGSLVGEDEGKKRTAFINVLSDKGARQVTVVFASK
jgi:hypothetical protein